MKKQPGPAKMRGNKGYKDGHPKPDNREVSRRPGMKKAMGEMDKHDAATKRKGSKGTGLRKRLEGVRL